MTPSSASGSYCPPAAALQYMDVNLLGQLCTDTGTALTLAQLQTNGRLVAELNAASGRLEAAALAGQRYAPTDLAALTGVTAAYRDKVVAKLAEWAIIADRRPASQKPEAAKEAEADLERLRRGEFVFGVLESQSAGAGAEVVTSEPDDPATETVTGVAQRFFGDRQWQF